MTGFFSSIRFQITGQGSKRTSQTTLSGVPPFPPFVLYRLTMWTFFTELAIVHNYLSPSYWLCSLFEYKPHGSREFNSFLLRLVPKAYHSAWRTVGSWQILAEKNEFKSFQKRKSPWDSRSLGTINICCCLETFHSDWPHIKYEECLFKGTKSRLFEGPVQT